MWILKCVAAGDRNRRKHMPFHVIATAYMLVLFFPGRFVCCSGFSFLRNAKRVNTCLCLAYMSIILRVHKRSSFLYVVRPAYISVI